MVGSDIDGELFYERRAGASVMDVQDTVGIIQQLALLKCDMDHIEKTANLAARAVSSRDESLALRDAAINLRIDNISTKMNIATGVWVGILACCLIIGLVLTLLQIHKG